MVVPLAEVAGHHQPADTAATAVTGIGGIALGSLEAWQAVLVGVQTVLVLLMIAFLEHASRHATRQEEQR